MTATLQLVDVGFRDRLNDLVQRVGDSGRVLRGETRKLLEEMQRQAPPGNAAQGKARVKADLMKVFFPLPPTALKLGRKNSQPAGATVPLWVTSGGICYSTARENFKPDASESEMRRIHQASRNARGRVSGRGLKITSDPANGKNRLVNRIVVKRTTFRRYERQALSHVGKMRAGWGIAMQAVGANVPAWVRKNVTPANGSVVDELAYKNPSVTVRNTTPGVVTEMGAAVRRAMSARARAIGANLLRMAKHGPGATGDYGYAKS